MDEVYVEGENFEGNDFRQDALRKGEYEGCVFTNCQLAGLDLRRFCFVDCVFEGCDFSGTNIHDTAFRHAVFRHCKLVGLRFDQCDTFLLEFRFEACILSFASFYGLSLKGTPFSQSKLDGVEFVNADLTSAVFDECDLQGSVFEQTCLEKADFRTANNLQLDPAANMMAGAKFSLEGLPGLLAQYNLVISP